MKRLALLFAAVSLLAGCFGGNDDDPVAPAPAPLTGVPDTATQSSAGLVSYLTALAAAGGADTAEPIDLTGLAPLAQPDNTEPEPVS